MSLAFEWTFSENAINRRAADLERSSTPFHRSVIHAGTEFESRMSDLFASLPARIGDSGY